VAHFPHVGLGAILNYYKATNLLAKRLSAIFEILMPECFQTFKNAFDAGEWKGDDPGPWLGRAIVYKLQVSLHKDRNGGGPTASYPIGFFSGGEMLIPQIKAKLSYVFYFFLKYHLTFFLLVTNWAHMFIPILKDIP
jgi:hypothetical protein